LGAVWVDLDCDSGVADGEGDGLGAVVGVALGWSVDVEFGVGDAVENGVSAEESALPQAAKVTISKKAGRPGTIAAEARTPKGTGRFI